jgi:antitoxin YefM
MKVLNYSDLRQNLSDNLNLVAEDHEVLIVSRSNEKNVVIISLDEYNSIQETLYLLSSEANAKRLNKALEEVNQGKFIRRKLKE